MFLGNTLSHSRFALESDWQLRYMVKSMAADLLKQFGQTHSWFCESFHCALLFLVRRHLTKLSEVWTTVLRKKQNRLQRLP